MKSYCDLIKDRTVYPILIKNNGKSYLTLYYYTKHADSVLHNDEKRILYFDSPSEIEAFCEENNLVIENDIVEYDFDTPIENPSDYRSILENWNLLNTIASTFSMFFEGDRIKAVREMILAGDTSALTAPGQFINIKLDGLYLRRPISICDYDEKTITIIYKVVGHIISVVTVLSAPADMTRGIKQGYTANCRNTHTPENWSVAFDKADIFPLAHFGVVLFEALAHNHKQQEYKHRHQSNGAHTPKEQAVGILCRLIFLICVREKAKQVPTLLVTEPRGHQSDTNGKSKSNTDAPPECRRPVNIGALQRLHRHKRADKHGHIKPTGVVAVVKH